MRSVTLDPAPRGDGVWLVQRHEQRERVLGRHLVIQGEPLVSVDVMVPRDEKPEWRAFAAWQGISVGAMVREAVRLLIETTDLHEPDWRKGRPA